MTIDTLIFSRRCDLVLWSIGFAALLTGVGWTASLGRKASAFQRTDGSIRHSPDQWQGRAPMPGIPLVEPWGLPPAQSRGVGWVYDVFTSPTIFRDTRIQSWTLSPPNYSLPGTGEVADVDVRAPDFGVEVVAIGLKLFPLQLVGYCGKEGRYFGTFENVGTKETFLGRPGRRVDELGVSIQKLTVERVKIAQMEGEPLTQVVAKAVVVSENSGEETHLTSLERLVVEAPAAHVRATGSASQCWVRENETFVIDDAQYRLERIDVAAGVAEIVRITLPGEQQARKTFSTPVIRTCERLFP